MAILEATGISKTYPGPDKAPVKVLEGVNMHLEGGKIHAIVGASGCGKSTLLTICGALLHPDSGTVRIDGYDPFSLNTNGKTIARTELLGYVFQDFHLIPYLTVKENILASTLATSGKHASSLSKTADTTGDAIRLAEEVGLGHRLSHRPGQLSAGEQQRVAIARALLSNPKVVIADEPTGSLDVENGKGVMRILREYADQGGLVLLATHNPFVAENADTVSTVKDRRIVPYA